MIHTSTTARLAPFFMAYAPTHGELLFIVIFSVVAALLLVTITAIVCACKRHYDRRNRSYQHFAPTGYVIHDANCGVGCCMYYSTAIICMAIAFLLTFDLFRFLTTQKYSLTGLQLNNATMFIFNSEIQDPVVHTSMRPSANVNVEFINNVLNVQVTNFTLENYGNLQYIKLFVEIGAQQFGSVSNYIEYDFDLNNGSHFYNMSQAITPVNTYSNSSRPEL